MSGRRRRRSRRRGGGRRRHGTCPLGPYYARGALLSWPDLPTVPVASPNPRSGIFGLEISQLLNHLGDRQPGATTASGSGLGGGGSAGLSLTAAAIISRTLRIRCAHRGQAGHGPAWRLAPLVT